MTNIDLLPLAEYLTLEVLAARHRLGESRWMFPSRCRVILGNLRDAGLIEVYDGTSGTIQASLTHSGAAAMLNSEYGPTERCASNHADPAMAALLSAVDNIGILTADMKRLRQDNEQLRALLTDRVQQA